MDRRWYVFLVWITRRDYLIRAVSDNARSRCFDYCGHFVVGAEFVDGAPYMELYRAFTQAEDDRDLACGLAVG